MFKFIVLLNQSPFYIFAMTEKETLDTVKVYREKVIGVVEGDNLNFKTLEVNVILKTQKVEALDFVEIVDTDYQKNKVDVLLDPEEHEEMIDDLQSDIN